MGALARALAPRDEVRGPGDDPGWWTRDDDVDGGRSTPSGVRVSRAALLGQTTAWRCIDLLSSAVSQAPKDVIVKIGPRRFPQFNKPDWLVMPHGPAEPTYTANDHFSEVALSVLFDGNYFVVVLPHVLDPHMVFVLDPQLVTCKARGLWEVRDRSGKVTGTLGPDQMLHGTWLRLPGQLRGISPLEALRRSIGGAIAAEDHAARYFGQGATLSFGVETPGPMDKAQRDELSTSLNSRYAGLKNSHSIGLLTNGAKFVPGLAPTPEQSQMLATRQFSVEDLCRPFGVPPHMVGSQQPGAVSYASVNGTLLEFKQYAVLPLAQRIEVQHNRLLSPPDVEAEDAEAQFKFNLDAIARADLLTRYQAHKEGVQGGFLTPREARTDEDLPPMADGSDDQLFMQMQMIPISTGEMVAKANAVGSLVRSGFEPEPAAKALGLEPIPHTGLVPVTLQSEDVASGQA